MPVPASINDLSTTAASNSPSGGENPFPELDDHLRKGYSFIAQLRDLVAGKLSTSSVSAFIQTLIDDADAATARTTLGAVGKTGDETVAGVKTFSSSPVVPTPSGGTDAANKAYVDTAAAAAAATALAAGRNRLINPTFAINQRSFAGGALTAGTYGHDRWKAGAGGANYSVSGETATISSGSIQQVIEGANIEGGTFVLSWTGTATASVNGGTAGASPLVTTGLTAGSNVTIQFNAGTVTAPQFEQGSTKTTFERRLIGAELALCLRYYQTSASSGNLHFSGYCANGNDFRVQISLPVLMRVAPTFSRTHVFSFGFPAGQQSNEVGTGFVSEVRKADSTQGPGVFITSWTASAEL